MTPIRSVPLFLPVLTLTFLTLNTVLVKAESSEIKIFTCCKFQSILDPLSGTCGASPVYEFEYEIFRQDWKLPKILTQYNPAIYKTAKTLTARFVERAPWCKCRVAKFIPLQLQKFDTNSNSTDESWNYENNIGSHPKPTILLTAEGRLAFVHSEEKITSLSPDQFCLNKLQYSNRDPENPSGEENLSVEFVQCAETCLRPNDGENKHLVESLLSSVVVSTWGKGQGQNTKVDWMRTGYCEDLEEADLHRLQSEKVPKNESSSYEVIEPICKKWVPFYYKNDNFLLIVSSKNITSAIQDSTYPWRELTHLFPNTFCKTRGSSSDSPESTPDPENEDETNGKLVKFCLSKIAKTFYGHQKLYAILAGISAFFLLFNLTIYFALRKSLSISGWTEFLYSLSLYAYFVFSIVGLLIIPEGVGVGPLCYKIALLIQYFELANGATLVALSFDIFWTFCKFDSENYTDNPKLSRWRLSLYIAFTLLAPLSIVAFGIVQNQSFSPIVTPPHYGILHCLSPSWPFSSHVQFGMQGLNLFLVLISAYIILNKKNQTSPRVFKFDVDEDDYVLDPDRLDIFAKLLLFVFVFWLVNFMEFFYDGEIFPVKLHLIGFHLANYSQGIFAFFILVCNRRTLRGLVAKDWNLRSLFRHACCMSKAGQGQGRVAHPGGEDGEITDESVPLSPLMKQMKTGSIRRSTVRGNAFY